MTYHDFNTLKAASTAELAAVAMGQKAGDLIIRNICLVNVYLGRVDEGMDLIVFKGIIVFTGDASSHPVGENTRVIEGDGAFLMPGLIDSHMHVESSMVDLPSFVAGILPHGTTTICPDIHEMTNVFGLKGIELFHKSGEGLPLKVLTAMPVCVPSIPGMEDAGAEIRAGDVATAYDKGWAELQGEQMNFPGVIFGDPSVHALGAEALKRSRVMTGHYSSPDLGNGLNAFIASGMSACHESTAADEALAKAGRGMYVQQRYGSAWLDLPNLLPAVLDNPGLDTRMFTMVTDDVTPLTIGEEGHLIRVLREAVRLGLEPVKAVQMVTLNAAQLLGKSDWIGSLAPGKAADMLLVEDLRDFKVKAVFTDGIQVADDRGLACKLPGFSYPDWALDSVHIEEQHAHDFIVRVPEDYSAAAIKTRIIRLVPGMVFTKEEYADLPVREGLVEANSVEDLCKLAVLYRHEMEVAPEDRKSLAFVRGVHFAPGCAYASTVSHDSHNMLVLGTDDEAMALAANTLKASGGGLVLVMDGDVLAHMALPFAGLMSLKSMDEAGRELKAVEEAFGAIGCHHISVEMTISLLALIVLPELHLSNKGLVQLKDGAPPCFVDLFPG